MKGILCVLAVCAAFPVLAQSGGNPAGMAPDTPGINAARPSGEHANIQDKLFVRQAVLGGRAEVELGKFAEGKATTDAAKQFAQRMVQDHGKSNDRLLRLARQVNGELPQGLDPEHQRMRTDLQQLTGRQFDIAYLAAQMRAHQKTANLLQWHLSYGQNEALKQYSIETLPIVMDHLEHARQQYLQLTGVAPDPTIAKVRQQPTGGP